MNDVNVNVQKGIAQRVMVIALDGATWDVLRPQMAAGRMPNLKRIVESGVSGDLMSVYTPETPTAWSSFMTGMNPGKHGVFDFLVYDPVNKTERPVNSKLRVGKTIWERLTEAGKTSLILNLPTTYPPKPFKGAMICDFLTPEGARDFAYPPELVDELERDYGKYPLFIETMCYIAVGSRRHTRMLLDELERIERVKFDAAAKLFDRYQPDFTMLHIWGTDRLLHELWSVFDPTHPRHNPQLAAEFNPQIDAYFAQIDRGIGQMLDRLGPNGVAFVISDHGNGPTHYLVDQNSWLLREGFIVLKKSLRVRIKKWLFDLGFNPYNGMRLLAPLLRLAVFFKAGAPEKALNRASGTINIPGMLGLKDVDWSRTRAYAPFGWSGVYVNTQGIRPNGSVPPEQYEQVRDEVVQRWNQLRNPTNGELVGGPVLTNAEMYHGPFSKYGPDVLPLPLANKYMPVCFFGFASKEPVYPNHTIPGNHRVEGVIAVAGPGVRTGTIDHASLMDLAPTILHLLGEPVPDSMDGQVLTDIFEPDIVAAHPVATIHAAEIEETASDALTEAEQEEIRNKLKGLGYL